MIYTSVSSSDLADLALAIKYEQDGAVMMKDLRRGLKAAVKPAETAAKAAIMSMPSTGLRNTGGSLRSHIRKNIVTQSRLSKSRASVKVKVRSRDIRQFRGSAWKLNKPGYRWRHPVLPFRKVGSGDGARVVPLQRAEWTWVDQRSPRPGWFDDAMKGRRPEFEAACVKAMNDAADRIARNT